MQNTTSSMNRPTENEVKSESQCCGCTTAKIARTANTTSTSRSADPSRHPGLPLCGTSGLPQRSPAAPLGRVNTCSRGWPELLRHLARRLRGIPRVSSASFSSLALDLYTCQIIAAPQITATQETGTAIFQNDLISSLARHEICELANCQFLNLQ